ncbi:YraN family protein [Actinokineospora cianjurensis]|uniref:UPF0102 protein CLV68_5019 n=1 Tax=Actinokineospora cianjurensis TaxID=585224 RepID=A0A421B0I2_9PSEU|nr:YraN family protein [Actinokineospora cianjurensis]RLK55531.1 putative endonuclease [Actinokineospora cianjurensis]
MATHLRLGAHGEDIAAHHLERDGATILARNWRCELGELDIICDHQGRIVICEVKTRTTTHHGTPAESVTESKARRLRTLAHRWRLDNGLPPTPLRFDIISILVPRQGPPTIHHLRGVL